MCRLIFRSEVNSQQIVAKHLLDGKVCVLPTDTVYGFSGIVPQSKKSIQAIKGRKEEKPFIQLIARPDDIYKYTDFKIPQKLFSLWPGAITIIVPVTRGEGDERTVAFRCPADSWLLGVLSLVGSPIYSTSVNRSGKPVLSSMEKIRSEFGGEVDLIVDGGSAMPANALPSTLVEITDDGSCKILRQGSVTIPNNLV